MSKTSMANRIAASLLVLTPAVVLGQTTVDKSKAASRPVVLDEARAAQLHGDVKTSLQKYSAAMEQAKRTGNTIIVSEAALSSARMIQVVSQHERSDASLLPKAVEQYQYVLKNGTPAQRKLAGNNLGVLYIQQGKAADAVESLRAIVNSPPSPELRDMYVVRYNFGRALEANKSLEQAYSQYKQVLREQPGFKPAAVAAFRYLESSGQPKLAEAAGLATQLIAAGQTEFAGAQIHGLLTRWSGDREAQRLLAALIQYYAATSLIPPDFNEKESKFLEAISEKSTALRSPIAEIRLAYTGKLAPTWVPGRASESFPSWTKAEWQYLPLLSLLKRVADYYDHQGEPQMALARYSLAWSLNRTDTQAILYCATVLRDHRELLDPNRRLLDELVRGLFQEKGMAYQKQDWLNILRYHMVLGTIFEREERWGPEGDSHSAVFQWSHALAADTQYRRANPDFPPSPGLYAHLAQASVHVGRPDLAWDLYLSAAGGFLTYDMPGDARKTLAAASALSLSLKPDQQTRFQKVQALVDAQATVPH